MKTLTNWGWYKREKEIINQLHAIGFIDDLEREDRLIRIKAIYISQKRDEQ